MRLFVTTILVRAQDPLNFDIRRGINFMLCLTSWKKNFGWIKYTEIGEINFKKTLKYNGSLRKQ